jgi:hypothetical protein
MALQDCRRANRRYEISAKTPTIYVVLPFSGKLPFNLKRGHSKFKMYRSDVNYNLPLEHSLRDWGRTLEPSRSDPE